MTLQDLLDRMEQVQYMRVPLRGQMFPHAPALGKFEYEIKEYTVGDKTKYEGTVFKLKALERVYTRTFYGESLDEVKQKIRTYVSVFAARDKIVESGNAKDLL